MSAGGLDLSKSPLVLAQRYWYKIGDGTVPHDKDWYDCLLKARCDGYEEGVRQRQKNAGYVYR